MSEQSAKRDSAADVEAVIARGISGRRRYSWPYLQQVFVEGLPRDSADPSGARDWLSLRELASECGASYQKVRNRAARDRWTDMRLDYQARVFRARMEQRARRAVDRGIEFDDLALGIARQGMRLVQFRLAEVTQDVHRSESDDHRCEVSAAQLMQLAKSAAVFQDIGNRAIGLRSASVPSRPSDAERSVYEVNIEGEEENRLDQFFGTLFSAGLLRELIDIERRTL